MTIQSQRSRGNEHDQAVCWNTSNAQSRRFPRWHRLYGYTVATAKNKSAPLYEQTKDALSQIDATLAEAGTGKSNILRATVYITDMSRKPDMDRAWDEWVDRANPPQRACIGVTLADKDLVEILVTAAQ